MKRIGIITVHKSPNYGACLQSFALYEYLHQCGHQVEVIDLRRPIHHDYIDSRRFRPFSHRYETTYQYLKRKIHAVVDRFVKKNNYLNTELKKTPDNGSVFDSFNNKIQFTRPFRSIDQLYADPPQYDTYITGSDQVWNPTQAYCIEPYFLTFVRQGRKISYASSIGIKSLTTKERRKYKKWLSGYDRISVREESARKMLMDLTGKEIYCVADPTFLLDRDYWAKLAEVPDSRNYILVFTLAFEKEIVEYGLRLAAESGKRLIVLGINLPDADSYTVVRDASVQQWLGYIANADMVITDSFHCTVFSIILNTRRFFTYISPYNDRGSRITDLLHRYGLEDNLLDVGLIQSYEDLDNIVPDNNRIGAVFNLEQTMSRKFLLDNL